MKNIIMLLFILILFSCSKNLQDLNKDVKNATTASGETFFTFGVKNLFDILGTAGYNASSTVSMAQIWAQHITLVTYTNTPQYYFDGQWTDMYTNVLKNLKESYIVTEKETFVLESDKIKQKNKLAIIEIMQVQTFAILVETFGNIPYSEALDYNNVLPKYDDGHSIYMDLMKRLNSAIIDLNTSQGSFSSGDPIYNGNVDKWRMFANSLKLKMGLRIVDVDAVEGAKAVVEAAADVFKSNADNNILKFQSVTPNTNPLWLNAVLGNRKDVVMAKPFIDSMNLRNDPRRDVFFSKINGKFIGGTYGQVVPFDDFSNYGTFFKNPALPGILLDYASVEFFLAEAAERSIVGQLGDAKNHYEKAIKASFEYYNVSGVNDYLQLPNVNYETAYGSWKEKIGVQKWIALFNQGFEAWTEYRRLDYPLLFAPAGAYINSVPVRSTYPIDEQTLNGENYSQASQAIGGDLMTTKLFWDKF